MEDERLETIFQLNVKGMTQFGSELVFSGIILAEADGTAGNLTAMFEGASSYKYFVPPPCTDDSDFERLLPIRVSNSANIRLFTANDDITLEYDDRVQLRFTPDNPALIPGLEGVGEFTRDSAIVNIIDDDCKYI